MPLKKLNDWLLPPDLKRNIDNAPKPLGSLDYDRWGYHRATAYKAASAARFLYEHYFKVRAYGRENIPKQGRVLIIANHSGYLPLDGALLGYSLLSNPYAPRVPRAMVERLFTSFPYIGDFFNQIGAVTGQTQNCLDMLKQDEALPMLGNAKGVAQKFGLPYFPITLPLPIPARVTLNFGEPLYFQGPVHSEDELEAKVNIVKAKIRQLIVEAQHKQGAK